MIRVIVQLSLGLALGCLLAVLSGEEKQFPQWRGNQLTLPVLWETASIVAVGDIRDVTDYGEQTVDRLAWPVTQDLHKLYWCQGDFYASAAIKGKLPAPRRKFLWASVNPGCRLFYGDRKNYEERVTRIWFLREEGNFLRPIVDGGSQYFIGFFAKWRSAPGLTGRKEFGELLLTPSANSRSLPEYANVIWDHAEIACSILERSECVQRLKTIADLGDPELRSAACDYLRTELLENCGPPASPRFRH